MIHKSHGPALPANWMVYKSVQVLPHHVPTFQTSTKQFLPVGNECVYAIAALCNVWTSFCSRTRCSTTHPHPYLALDRLRIHVKLCEYFEGFDMTSIWERPRQHLQAAEHRMGIQGLDFGSFIKKRTFRKKPLYAY